MATFFSHTSNSAGCRRALGGVVFAALLVALFVGGCSSSEPYTLDPIKTEDPDREPIPKPESNEQNQYWDRIYLSTLYQLQKPLDLNWTGRRLGEALGVADGEEAHNVNALDEPPRSSWWRPRHYYDEMSPRELALGANERDATGPAAGPDTSATWTVTGGKFEGSSPGFWIQDARGDRFLIKLDAPEWMELASSAEVISTKIYHAAGYNVPQNTITEFTLDHLEIEDGATAPDDAGGERPMRRADLQELLDPYMSADEDTVRGLASKFVDGDPIGPFGFKGRRGDDPNDRVLHEHRRELRGLRVISSWINDTDRRAANTLDVYTDDEYVKRYLLSMNQTLGSGGTFVRSPLHGHAYMIDQRIIPQALLSAGTYHFPWWESDHDIPHPSVGYFWADVFDPGSWVMTYPNPAFEKMTLRDAFWGAKIVMSFSDDDLETIVETAQMSTPEAEQHILDVLKERRDKVGRYWFERVNPLDRFQIDADPDAEIADRGSAYGTEAPLQLQFDDLAIRGDLAPADSSSYAYRIYHDGAEVQSQSVVDAPTIPLTIADASMDTFLEERGLTADEDRVFRIDIRTQRPDRRTEPTRVYVHYPADGAPPRIAGIERVP